ncbi:zinc finger CCCH domain-containing protein 2 [Vigna radiata var. radiata]|uniref:Zinc finger CCCH domain-containing protein 2 n=1 Tax=Vigna radiata var. radiata TaxID=3916 RepID=A0A1S3TD85_VIGRR|nr:zinc finger CCCH domain-containing protein 2 [Vigna radiata var. radiata]
MSSVSSDHHKFHPSHQFLSPNKTLREIDVPPRKLLTRRTAAACAASELFSDDTMLQKFLPSNSLDDSDEDDPYSADHFRMFEFKVRRCTRSRSHDWTDCPFAHPGEKARRRDPRRYHYSGTVCPEYRRGGCNRGDACEFAHGVFECWLHPARYRTEACKDGKNCKRKVCFFAHTPRQLRILPVTSPSSNDMSCKKNIKNLFNHASRSNNSNNGCCLFCHCVSSSSSSTSTASPTSTLFNMSHYSPPLSPSSSSSSPPPSPLKPRKGVSVSPISLYGAAHHGVVSYKEAFAEFVNSLEGLSLNEGSPVSGAKPLNLPWIDVSLTCEEQLQQQRQPLIASSFGCEDQQQFTFSPSSTQTPTNVAFCSNRFTGSSNNNNNVVGADSNVPDLAWVNELLM